MSSFNVELQRSYAKKRHVARLTEKHDVASSKKKLDDELISICGIEKIIEWCASKNVKVVMSSKEIGGAFEQSTRELILNIKMLPQKMLHLMLHEAGHMLIGEKKPHERFGRGYNAKKTTGKAENFSHRVDVIDEELCAWAEGEILAKKLKIMLDHDEYMTTRDKNIRTYFEWIVRTGKYKHLKDEDDTDTYATP